MSKKKLALWFDGILSIAGRPIQDAIAFSVDLEPINMTHKKAGGGELTWQVGRNVVGKMTYTAMTAELLAALTGGTITAAAATVVRSGEESHTIATNSITLAEAGDVIENSIQLYGANGTIFTKVASTPAEGEYSYEPTTGVCTFNSGETETDIDPSYIAIGTGTGKKVSLGANSVPERTTLYGALRAKDMNTKVTSDMVIELKKVDISGKITLGGDSEGSTTENELEFSADVAASGDFAAYFPE